MATSSQLGETDPRLTTEVSQAVAFNTIKERLVLKCMTQMVSPKDKRDVSKDNITITLVGLDFFQNLL